MNKTHKEHYVYLVMKFPMPSINEITQYMKQKNWKFIGKEHTWDMYKYENTNNQIAIPTIMKGSDSQTRITEIFRTKRTNDKNKQEALNNPSG